MDTRRAVLPLTFARIALLLSVLWHSGESGHAAARFTAQVTNSGQRTIHPVTRALTPLSTTSKAAPLLRTSKVVWGVIGDDTRRLADESARGITVKVVRLSWKDLFPNEGTMSNSYIGQKQAEFAAMRAAGFQLIGDLGIQDSPPWVHANYTNSYYVDQYGDQYQGPVDSGDVNLVFNPAMRTLGAHYIQAVISIFGRYFSALRIGGGPSNELDYALPTFNGHTNCYWAFDATALSEDPVPTWRPGQTSPHGEAAAFLTFYLQALTDYQTWQITTVRQAGYAGQIMVLYPSYGIRPGQAASAIADNLDGTSVVEINGETSTGVDYARQVAAITDPNVIVYSTWLDFRSPYQNDAGSDPTQWTPIKYLAALAQANPRHLRVGGENTGQGSAAALTYSVEQSVRYGLINMNWYTEQELYSGQYATPAQYQQAISTAP